jgi:uncharacterized protein YyaL (SSP411 family)
MAAEPIPWFEWSEEAFLKAEAEDKPIVLDLMAAWSQGCRVMDETVYRDPEIAALMRRDYVGVRVDADRRPDLNERYNLGGWPTTAFLTPAGLLMGGTTIVTREQMKQLLVQLKHGYQANKDRLAEEIARRDEKIREVLEPEVKGVATLSIEIFRKTVRGIVATHDALHGGFGEAPKQPLPASLRVVLQAFHETRGPDFGQVLAKTMDAMAGRGMVDPVAGGFFHYATTNTWSAARTEKLCEDNAQLARLYLDAATVLERPAWRERAFQALAWARDTLLDPVRGTFAASQAGDDEYYGLAPARRKEQPAPAVDRTVLVPASATMAVAFLRAAQVSGDDSWAEPALRGLDWIRRECVRDGAVAHYHDGAANQFALARAPIVLAGALLDAYEHDGRQDRLEAADRLMEDVLRRFWSEEHKGIVDRAVDAGGRADLALPRRLLPENSLAAEVFGRLWRHTGEERQRRCAERILLSFPDLMDSYGHVSAEYALAADWLFREPEAVVRAPGALAAWKPRRLVRGA